jgi:hypothetical protein
VFFYTGLQRAYLRVSSLTWTLHSSTHLSTHFGVRNISPDMIITQWRYIDDMLTVGLAESLPSLRVSRKLHSLRKKTAQLTGMHGFLSGKGHESTTPQESPQDTLLRLRIAAMERARANLDRLAAAKAATVKRAPFWKRSQKEDGSNPEVVKEEEFAVGDGRAATQRACVGD